MEGLFLLISQALKLARLAYTPISITQARHTTPRLFIFDRPIWQPCKAVDNTHLMLMIILIIIGPSRHHPLSKISLKWPPSA